jgi:hypothetical protein
VLIACSKKPADAAAPPSPQPKQEAPAKTQAVLMLPEPEKATARPVFDAGEPEVLQGVGVAIKDVPPSPPSPPQSDEPQWRRRFREARARIDGFDGRLERAKEIVGQSDYAALMKLGSDIRVPVPEGYEDAKRLVDNPEQERQAGLDALQDLEREAANAGVPLEWRR